VREKENQGGWWRREERKRNRERTCVCVCVRVCQGECTRERKKDSVYGVSAKENHRGKEGWCARAVENKLHSLLENLCPH